MSKSANNIINILDDKSLRKQVMSIETDSTPLEDPKTGYLQCFAIYSLLATGTNRGYGTLTLAEITVTVMPSKPCMN
jgi:tryptophanyl-tRNA synthetase